MKSLVVKIQNGEKGVFANKRFLSGEKILDFSGSIMRRSKVDTKKIITPEDDRFLQVGKNIFIGPSGKVDDLVNHSCDPTAAVLVKNRRVALFAIKDVKKGEEITYDYSLQMIDEPWTMKCRCGSKKCRKIIREYRYLPKKIKKFYLKLGFVPEYNKGL